MKRHPALQDLSRDHFHVLFRCQRIRRALAREADWTEVGGLVDDLLAFFDSDMSPHFREEDELVVPAAAQTEELREVAQQTLDEHGVLRRAIGELRRVRATEADVRRLLATLEPQIAAHVKIEEQDLFEGLQSALPESRMQELGRRSLAFRQEHRGPDAIGPRRGRG